MAGRANHPRPRALPLSEHLLDVVADRGARDVRGDRAHGVRPRTQPGLSDGPAHGRPRGPVPDRRPGRLRPGRLAGRADAVPLRGSLCSLAHRARGRRHPAALGPTARGPDHPLPRRAHVEEGDGSRSAHPVEDVGRGGDRLIRAGGGAAARGGLDRVARPHRAGHPTGVAALQPGRLLARLHQQHLERFPGNPHREVRRHRRPSVGPPKRRVRADLDARRAGDRLRGGAGSSDLRRVQRLELGRRRERPCPPDHARRAGL